MTSDAAWLEYCAACRSAQIDYRANKAELKAVRKRRRDAALAAYIRSRNGPPLPCQGTVLGPIGEALLANEDDDIAKARQLYAENFDGA